MDCIDPNDSNRLVNLPYDILRLIGEYTNINSLLNTCSQLHQLKELKRSKFKNGRLVTKYCNSSKFKKKIDKCTNIYELEFIRIHILLISQIYVTRYPINRPSMPM